MKIVLLALALSLASCASNEPDIVADEGWARATVAGQNRLAAYFSITNNGDAPISLTSVTSQRGAASLHGTSSEGGMMRMRPVEMIEVPAHETVTLEPGGYHVMIEDFEGPLLPGQGLALDLAFSNGAETKVAIGIVDPASR